MAPSSASAVDDMTFLIICAMVSMAPFFGGNVVFFDRKKCPLARLRSSSSLR